jgi:hypothetical protein
MVILVNLYSLMIGMEAPELRSPHVDKTVLILVLLLGLGIYILGLILLYRAAQPVRGGRAWAERLLLVILPLGLPLALLLFLDWTLLMSRLYGQLGSACAFTSLGLLAGAVCGWSR